MARAKDRDKPVQIIEAAFSVFGETGFEATRIQSIAKRAGISSGTIYTYFRDKKDLFRATVQEGWDRFLGQIEELAHSPMRAEARVASFLEIGFGSLKRYLPLLRGMLFESSQMRLLQENLERFCTLVERLLPPATPRSARGASPNRWGFPLGAGEQFHSPAEGAHPAHGSGGALHRGVGGPRLRRLGDRRTEAVRDGHALGMMGMRTRSAAGAAVLSLLMVCPVAWPDSLTIDQAYDLARTASEAVRVKALAVRKAGSAVQEAQARALPHLDLQASTSYLTNPPTGITVTQGEFGTFSPEIPPHTLRLGQTQPISLGSVSLPSSDVQVGASSTTTSPSPRPCPSRSSRGARSRTPSTWPASRPRPPPRISRPSSGTSPARSIAPTSPPSSRSNPFRS